MNRFLILSIFLFSIISCKKETIKKVDISSIPVTVAIDRFEEKFYNTTEQSLSVLKNEYPFLFPIQNPDSVWLNRINSEDEKKLFVDSQEVFGDFNQEKIALENLFRHVKHHHSDFKSPRIITLITNLDYENKVMYADSLLFISLDLYLGETNEVYRDFPKYLSQNFDKTQLIVDVAHAITERYLLKDRSRQFLNTIIEEGKKMYMVDSYLASISDAQKIGYSNEKLQWTINNESQIWKYFIENQLLYSTDSDLHARFVENAPFSKFYIDIDKESPGKIGVWLGWQIVRSYMFNNNVTLQQLLSAEATEIFNKSKYKPKK